MEIITPVLKSRVVMAHQDSSLSMRGFSVYEKIRCCPKCGERDI